VWSLLIAGVVWQGASRSVTVGRARRGAAGVDLRPLLAPAVVLPARAVVTDVPPLPLGVRFEATVLTDDAGAVVAVVDPAALASVPDALRATTALGAVARSLPGGAIVTRLRGPDALAQVARGLQVSDVLVVVGDAGVLGTLTRERLVAAFSGTG
ncbi:MAG: hypothetical protein J0H73_10785, partial [Salana multivorans]|nr:hypothetical protein [Salana multivorans]